MNKAQSGMHADFGILWAVLSSQPVAQLKTEIHYNRFGNGCQSLMTNQIIIIYNNIFFKNDSHCTWNESHKAMMTGV